MCYILCKKTFSNYWPNLFRLALLSRAGIYFDEANKSNLVFDQLDSALKHVVSEEEIIENILKSLNQVLTNILSLGGSLLKVLFLFPEQCDQIWLFLKSFGDKFTHNNCPYIKHIFKNILENPTFIVKTSLATFGSAFENLLGYFLFEHLVSLFKSLLQTICSDNLSVSKTLSY